MSQYIKTVNRLEPSWPNFKNTNNDQVSLVYDVSSPGTAYQDKAYGMAGLGSLGNTFDDTITALMSPIDPTGAIYPYFTSTNYYVGFIGIGALVFLLTSKGSAKASRAVSRRARIKGVIAKEQELLKA